MAAFSPATRCRVGKRLPCRPHVKGIKDTTHREIAPGSRREPRVSLVFYFRDGAKIVEPQTTPMTFGRLVALANNPGQLHFVGRRWMRHYHTDLTLDGLEITQEPRFFSEDVVLYDLAGTQKLVLRLPSGHRAMANRIVESLIMRRDARMPMPSDRIMMAETSTEAGAPVAVA